MTLQKVFRIFPTINYYQKPGGLLLMLAKTRVISATEPSNTAAPARCRLGNSWAKEVVCWRRHCHHSTKGPAEAVTQPPITISSIVWSMIPNPRINSISDMVATTPIIKKDALKLSSAVAGTANEFSPVDYIRCIIPEDLETSDAESQASINKTNATEGYTMEAVGAIRSNDVAALRYMLEDGHCFDACNANGEYLIHLACRRGSSETVEFLINEAKVRVDVRDTMGRTILHDVCWKSSADLEMMSTVLEIVPPSLLLAKDLRGHTPFDFARKQHWKQWLQFLSDNQEMIQQRVLTQ